MRLLVIVILLRLLLGTLLLLVIVVLMLLFGLALLGMLLLIVVVLLFALLLLSIGRSSDSKNQRQNGGGRNSNNFHRWYLNQCSSHGLLYCKLPVVALAGLPMASPDTRSSTLRFCCRPAEVLLEATGKVSPKPLALTASAATPCSTR